VNVYILEHIADDPRFGRLEFPEDAASLIGRESLSEDFNPEAEGKLDWQPVSLQKHWTPQRAVGGAEPYNDYPCIGDIPAFSERAARILRTELEENGELLPLVVESGSYFAYNLLTKSLALDVERSVITFPPKGIEKETAFAVDRFEFYKEELQKHSIFRVREYPVVVLVSESFKRKAEDAQLNGLNFIKIYPMPEGQSWDDLETERWRARRKLLEPLRGQCVVIALPASSRPASEDEKQVARQIVHDLEAVMATHVKSLGHGFIGSVDELTEQQGELLVFVTCPDANELVKLIKPGADKTQWPQKLRLEKLYGNRFEKQTRRISVD